MTKESTKDNILCARTKSGKSTSCSGVIVADEKSAVLISFSNASTSKSDRFAVSSATSAKTTSSI